jgi:hypothetical protein
MSLLLYFGLFLLFPPSYHCLRLAEPFMFSKRNTRGVFSLEAAGNLELLELRMMSLPADGSTSDKHFVMRSVCKWNTPHLEPFEVQVRRDGGLDTYTVVYCQCRADEAPQLVHAASASASSPALASPLAQDMQRCNIASASVASDDEMQWRFWTIERKSPHSAKYRPRAHNLVSGDIVTFTGRKDALPPGIEPDNTFTVIIASTSKAKLQSQSFDVCSTVTPIRAFHLSTDQLAHATPQIHILRSAPPVVLYAFSSFLIYIFVTF